MNGKVIFPESSPDGCSPRKGRRGRRLKESDFRIDGRIMDGKIMLAGRAASGLFTTKGTKSTKI
jgi:hypothetical protein